MEQLAHKISEKIAIQMQYDEEKKTVIAYGLTAIIQILTIAALISVIGILCRVWYEAFIIFIGVGILKKSTGGAHSQTILSCTIISVVSISFFAIVSRYLFYNPMNMYISYAVSSFIFILCFAIFYKYVPVDSPNKPITKPEKIKRLRHQSFILLIIYTLLSYVFNILGASDFRFYSLLFSIHFVLLWQAFMLTKSGMKLICFIDSKFFQKEVQT